MKKPILITAMLSIAAIAFLLTAPPLSDVSEADASGNCGVGDPGDNLTWTFVEATNTLTINGSGAMKDFTLHDNSSWNPYKSQISRVVISDGVTHIGDLAFDGYPLLTDVTFPSTLETIGQFAFRNSAITDASFEGLTEIGYRAFHNCSSLTNLSLPETLTHIGEESFRECTGLTGLTIPDSVERLSPHAFNGCTGLTRLSISIGLSAVGDMPSAYAFEGCTNITHITLTGSTGYTSYNGYDNVPWRVNEDKDITVVISDEVTSIGIRTFKDCTGIKNLTMPITLGAVTNTNNPAFEGCTGITNITFTAGSGENTGLGIDYKSGWDLYYPCDKTPWKVSKESAINIVLSEGITRIGNNMFRGCTGLASITIPSTLESIGADAFTGCENLTSISIPVSMDATTGIVSTLLTTCTGIDSITLVGSGDAFDYNDETYSNLPWFSGRVGSVAIGNDVKYIGDYTFNGYEGSISIPASVVEVGMHAFAGCDLSTSDLSGLRYTGSHSFAGCAFSSPDLSSLILAATYAFAGSTGLTDVDLSNAENIHSHAFEGCASITSLVFSDALNVNGLGDYAFAGCTSLTSLTIPVDVDTIRGSDCHIFDGCESIETLVLVPGSGDVFNYAAKGKFYQHYTSAPWNIGGNTLRSVTIEEGVESIGSGIFKGCSLLTSVSLPDSLTTIGGNAFEGCTSLTEVVLPEGFESSPGQGAFSGCTSLETLTFPITCVIEITGPQVFGGCTSLKNIIITAGDTGIGGNYKSENSTQTPWGCAGPIIESITISEGITSIGKYMFYGCTSITTLTLPSTLTAIGEYAFQGCTNLTSINLGNVSTLGVWAFKGCTSLTVADLTGTASIPEELFSGCTSLTSIEFGTLTSVGANAFPHDFDGGCTAGNLSDKTFYLQENLYKSGIKVTLDLGAHGSSFIVVASGSAVPALTDPSVDGWVFSGWFEDDAFSTEWDFETTVSSATTIYARWARNISAVDVDIDGTYTYNRGEQTVSYIIRDGATALVKDTDYIIVAESSDTAATNAGTYSITIKGIGDYAGTSTFEWTIDPLKFADSIAIPSQEFTGSAIEPVVDSMFTGFQAGATYDAAYSDNVNAGTATVTLTGTGNYTGVIKTTFTITPKTLTESMISVGELTYNGSAQNAVVTVDGGIAIEGVDYTVHDNTQTDACDNYSLTVIAVEGGNYEFSAVKTWSISKAKVDKPTASTTVFTYNGNPQTYDPTNFDSNTMVLVESNEFSSSRTIAGSQKVKVSLKDTKNYEWNDVNQEDPEFTFTIGKKALSKEMITVEELTYDGTVQTPTIAVDGVNATFDVDYTIAGETTGTNAGDYTFKVTAEENGSYSGEISKTWTISRMPIEKPAADTEKTYTGTQQQFSLPEYYQDKVGISNNERTAAGTQFVNISLGGNYIWSDNSIADASIEFTIQPATLTITADDKKIPFGADPPAYTFSYSGFVNGETKSLVTGTITPHCSYIKNDDRGGYDITLSSEDASAPNYDIVYEKGTLTVGNIQIAKPTAKGGYTYTGDMMTLIPNGFDGNTMELEGNEGTDAGTYVVTVRIINTEEYEWDDGTQGDIELHFTIDRKEIAKPTADAKTFTFNGSEQTFTPIGFDDGIMSIYNNEKTDAGTYEVKVTLDSTNHRWISGDNENVILEFTIGRKTLEATDITVGPLTYNGSTQNATVMIGEIDAIASEDFTVTGTSSGKNASATYTLNVAANETAKNYTGSTDKTWSISKKDLTLRPRDISVPYGSNSHVFSIEDEGFVVGEGINDLVGSHSFRCNYSTTVPAGDTRFIEIVSGYTSGNYEIHTENGILTVVKAKVAKPTASTTVFTYNGSEQNYIPLGYNDSLMILSENSTRRIAGKATVTVSLSDEYNYEWDPESTGETEFEFEINKRALTADLFYTNDITYNGYEQMPGFWLKVDDKYINGWSSLEIEGERSGRDAGTYHAKITATDAVNYTGSTVFEWSISKKDLIITATSFSVEYGTGVPDYKATGLGFVTEDYISMFDETIDVTSEYVSSAKAGSTFTINVSGCDSDPNYNVTYQTGTLTVVKKKIDKPTADPRSFTFNGSTQVFEPAGYDSHLMDVAGHEQRNAGTHNVTVSFKDRDNYEWRGGNSSDLTLKFIIGQKEITYDIVEMDRMVYSGASQTVTVTLDDGLGILNTDFTLSGDVTARNVTVAPYSTTITGKATGNYRGSYEMIWYMDKAPLSIIADDISIEYGTASPEYTVSIEGFVNGETKSVLSGALTPRSDYRSTDNAGVKHDITVGGCTSDSYAITFVPGKLTVIPKAMSIDIAGATESRVYNGESQTLTGFTAAFESAPYDISKLEYQGVASATGRNAGDHPMGLDAGLFRGKDANYAYTFNVTDGCLTITRKAVTVTAEDESKTYGENDPVFTATVSGLIDGDEGLIYTVTRANGENAGTYDITPSGEVEQGSYSITYKKGELTIDKATLRVTSDMQVLHNADPPVYEPRYIGFVNDDDASVITGTPVLTCAYAKGNDNGTYTITVTGELTATNYIIITENGTLTVGKRQVERPSANETAFTYNGSAQTYLPAGWDDVTMRIAGNVQTDAGTYTVTVELIDAVGSEWVGDGPDSYTFTFAIAKRAIADEMVAIGTGLRYNGSVQSASISFNGAAISESTEVSVTGQTSGTNAGSYTITVTATESGNYTGSVQKSWSIARAPLTLTVGSHTIPYGTATPEFAVSANGFVNNETIAVLSGTPVFRHVHNQYIPVGNYGVSVEGYTSTNYDITPVNGNITVIKAKLDKPTADATAYTYNGLERIYAPTGFDAETMILGNGARTVAGGQTVTVSLKDPENYEWNGADQSNPAFTFTIDRAPLTVVAVDKRVQQGGAPPEYTYSFMGLVNNETDSVVTGTPSLTCAYTAGDANGEFQIVITGTLTAENYIISLQDGTLVVGGKIKLTRPTPHNGAFTYTGTSQTYLPAGWDEVTMRIAGNIQTDAGTYDVTVSVIDGEIYEWDGDDQSNPAFTFTIAKAMLTVTVGDVTITYGDQPPAYASSATGFVNNETAEVLGGTLAYACDYAFKSPVGTYEIAASGYESSNYDFTYAPGSLTVERKQAAITPVSATKVVGEADPSFTANITGLLDGDSVAYTIVRAPGESAGRYAIMITADQNQGGYTLRLGSSHLMITAPAADTPVEYESENGSATVGSDRMAELVKEAQRNDELVLTIAGEAVVSFDRDAILALGSGDVTLTQSRLTRESMGDAWNLIGDDRAVYDISIGASRDFGSGRLTIRLPYALAEGEDPSDLVVLYIADGVVKETIPCTYADGFVVFETSHLSVYGVKHMSDDGGSSDGGISPAVVIAIGVVLILAVIGGAVFLIVKNNKKTA